MGLGEADARAAAQTSAPAHMKAVSGRKTDVRDAEWIAQLLEHGLLTPSFVPPPPIRQLRLLTRYGEKLKGDRTRETVRLELMLEDASIKLSTVATSLNTLSARAMLAAMIDGESDGFLPRSLIAARTAAANQWPAWCLTGSSCDIGKKTEYISDAAQRKKIGQIEDAQQTAEYQDVLQQEADLTAGHGVLRCTGFVAVSASDPDELERAVAAIEQAAIQASCQTRRLWGQQAQALAAAALPLARPV